MMMPPMPLATKNRRRVDPMPPDPTTRTDVDGSFRCINTSNPSKSRSWQEYREIW